MVASCWLSIVIVLAMYGNTNVKRNVCFTYFLYELSEKFLILRRTQGDTVINVDMCSYKIPVILLTVYWKLDFIKWFSKIPQINITQIFPVGAELFHADIQTEGQWNMAKLIVTFRTFADAPKSVFSRHSNFIIDISEKSLRILLVRDGARQEERKWRNKCNGLPSQLRVIIYFAVHKLNLSRSWKCSSQLVLFPLNRWLDY